MRLTTTIFMFIFSSLSLFAQELITKNSTVNKAFALAVKTLYRNTQDNLIKAGGSYGGEWTRDIAINSWNAGSLISPGASQHSLWSVTINDKQEIGHQYWDQIIWTIAAYDYYLTNNDQGFLRQAYIAASNTMAKLEHEAYDSQYGLFTGPSVFNDGISGYEEPIYDPKIHATYVLDFPASKDIKCLSTNCLYVGAYIALSQMALKTGDKRKMTFYKNKAAVQKQNIRKWLYDRKSKRLNYLIDQNGIVHKYQEGLGIAFAILFNIVNKQEALQIVAQTYVSKYGLPSIYPHFKRFTNEKPGRHNVIIWPFVNAFWADACHKIERKDIFEKEFLNLADLAINHSNHNYYEIYNAITGEQDGGWQMGEHTVSVSNQTWSATGFLRMIFKDILGLHFSSEGMIISPDIKIIKKLKFKELKDLNYQFGKVTILVHGNGNKLTGILLDGKRVKRALISSPHSANSTLEFILK